MTDLAFRMNEYDEYAVEQAVQLQGAARGDAPRSTVLSIGPDRVVEAIKKALAMGCDRAVHVQDDALPEGPVADRLRSSPPMPRTRVSMLIFTGMQSQDRGSAQVGVIVAELLGIACATTLVGFAYADGAITAKRELEGGMKGVVKLKTPAAGDLPAGAQCSPLSDPSQHHEGEEEGDPCRFRSADLLHEEPLAATASFYPPAKKGGGIVLEGERRRSGRQADRHSEGKDAVCGRAGTGMCFARKEIMKTLLIGEYREGKLLDSTYELLAFAGTTGCRAAMLLVGSAAQLSRNSTAEIYLADAAELRRIQPRSAQAAGPGPCAKENPDYIVFVHSSYGWDLAPRVAAALKAGQVSEVIAAGRWRLPGRVLQRQDAAHRQACHRHSRC